MLKRIPKSDISIRPFKAYKEWDRTTSNASVFEAENVLYSNSTTESVSVGYLNGLVYNKASVYGQLRGQFYNGNEDNPFLRFGAKRNYYEPATLAKERYLESYAKVISIPQIAVGEGIKKFSVQIVDSTGTYYDDGYGNIQNNDDGIVVNLIDNQTNQFYFVDFADNVYSASAVSPTDVFVDLESGSLQFIYSSTTPGGPVWGDNPTIQIRSFDVTTGIMIVDDLPFLPESAQGIKVGNVFYTQGLIILTRDAANKLANGWTLDYKSTETIYENEFLLIVQPDEFNVSQNPSAVVTVGMETTSSVDSNNIVRKITTNSGVKYIRKKSVLDNGDILDYRFAGTTGSAKAGFEHWEASGSADSTGSFLAPFITTIGLYDDNCDLVAVAKLPQAIKSDPELPVNFIVRFDT
jgi:hypothetical protein